nr:AMP-binding protein [Plastoroseomonas hellenica]
MQREPAALYAHLRVDGSSCNITRADLAARMAAHLAAWKAAGVGRGDIVFIILRHGPDLMPAFLAAMWAGAIPSYLPYPNPRQDPTAYTEIHKAVFARTGARALLTEPDFAVVLGKLLTSDGGVKIITRPVPVCDAALPPPADAEDDAAALLQHSSGTTGLKKGVILTFGAITDQIDTYAGALGLSDRSRIATWLPLYHDMGLVACFLLPTLLGIPIFAIDPFEWVTRPSLLLEIIEEHRATHVWLPNFAFAHITRAVPASVRHDLSSIEMLIGCSEPNRPDTYDRFLARFGRCGITASKVQTCYAMAETVFAVSQSSIGHPPGRLAIAVEGSRIIPGERVLLSNGAPLPGVEVAIATEGVLHRKERIAGELCIATPFNFKGYFGGLAAPEDGFHRTGDIGFLDQGEIYILGRDRESIIVNGRNFYAHDIEAAASSVAGVRPGRCVALGVASDRTGSEDIVVIAEAEKPRPSLPSEINRALLGQLGVPAASVELVQPGWLLKTTSGKIARAENLKKYLSQGQRPGSVSGESEPV